MAAEWPRSMAVPEVVFGTNQMKVIPADLGRDLANVLAHFVDANYDNRVVLIDAKTVLARYEREVGT